MRYNALVNSFTDLAPQSWMRNPHIIVRADEISTVFGEHATMISGDDWWLTMPTRPVLYEDASGNKYFHELVPYVHPVGAGSLTIGTLSTAADGVVTYTPTQEGRLLAEAGVLVPILSAPQNAIDIAGMLFADYYYHFTDNMSQHESFRAITIEEGDFLWLVRRGDVELDGGAAITDGDILNSSDVVAGGVLPATAIDTTTAVTLFATLEDHLWGPNFHAIAQAKETTVGAGMVRAWLDLPPRFSR